MPKKLLVYILIVALMASNFTRVMVYVEFKANQKYIAENLCVNRNKPVMHCNGKCYLAKKLKQADDKEKSEEQQSQKKPFSGSDDYRSFILR